MEETPQVNVQAVVEALMERIGALELEVAVLKSILQQKEQLKEKKAEESPEDEPGLYL